MLCLNISAIYGQVINHYINISQPILERNKIVYIVKAKIFENLNIHTSQHQIEARFATLNFIMQH